MLGWEGVKELERGPPCGSRVISKYSRAVMGKGWWKEEWFRGSPPHFAGFLNSACLSLLGEGSGDTEKLTTGSFTAGKMLC